MALTLYSHPLASFCHKALIALYENATPFEPVMVDLGDPASRAAFEAVWPMVKMPVLRDDARNRTVPEATLVVEYLDAFYPGPVRFVPTDPDLAWQVRLWDRFFDHYVQHPMQKIVIDRIRPEDGKDPHGVQAAIADLRTAYGVLETRMAGREWAVDDSFGLADCAAAPALYYADRIVPFSSRHPALAAYLGRLRARPSFARVLAEAEPYFPMFPFNDGPAVTD